MTHGIDDHLDFGPEHGLGRPLARRRLWPWIAVLVVLALIGAASAVLWRSFGDPLTDLASFTSSNVTSSNGTSSNETTAAADRPVGLNDFQAFQQQSTAQLQSATQLLASQQEEIKALSEQVAALTAKIEALQRPSATVQAAMPAAAAPPAARPAKKKPAAKPAPGISVGGAPLPPEPQPSR